MKVLTIKNLRNWLLVLGFIFSVGGVLMTTTPQVAFAASAPASCTSNFLGFPAWYRGLQDGYCDIQSPTDSGGLSGFIWTIGLNVVEMALVLVAYIAGFMFLYGGWLFIFSQGKPEGIAKGKSTMTMALIGLVVSLVAVGIITYIWAAIIK